MTYRLLKRLAPAVMALLTTGAAHAAEMLVMPPGTRPLATIPMQRSGVWFDAIRNLPPSLYSDGILISFPVEFASRDCSPGTTVTLFRMEPLDKVAFARNDPRGLTYLALNYSPSDGILSVRTRVQPLIDGKRIDQPIDYEFKILDRFAAPKAFCGKSRSASAYRFNLYLNRSSFIIEATPLFGGLSPFYLSPVNIGVGDFLWEGMVNANDQVGISGSPGDLKSILTEENRQVRLYGLNWTASNPNGARLFNPKLYNVKDSVNYQYGAKAYPTASPTLGLPRAAAALLTPP